MSPGIRETKFRFEQQAQGSQHPPIGRAVHPSEYRRAEVWTDPDLRFYSSGWGDLNSRPSVPQTDALTKLRHSPRRSATLPAAPAVNPTETNQVTSSQRPWMRRQPRYTTAAPAKTQKCHGTFWERTGAPPASVTRSPHDGHVPTTDTELGLKKRAHGSHHGTSDLLTTENDRVRPSARPGWPNRPEPCRR